MILQKIACKPSKSLMRMLGPRGNPQVRNLSAIVGYLQEREGVRHKFQAVRWNSTIKHSMNRLMSLSRT